MKPDTGVGGNDTNASGAGHGVGKLRFSFSKKIKSSGNSGAAAFEGSDDDEDQLHHHGHHDSHDGQHSVARKEPLVIQVQEDSRMSLREQARMKRGEADERVTTDTSQEDEVAIEALKREAAGQEDSANGRDGMNKNMVIASSSDTFQHGGGSSKKVDNESEDRRFQHDLEKLAPTLPVQSKAYKAVPISEFGAAMLRGMGWTGDEDGNGKKQLADPTTMPRPSRLGLGATPKILASADGDLPATHSRRRPRRQDQVQREERLKRQQEEFERNRQRQIALDKQQTLQDGSLVWVDEDHDFSNNNNNNNIKHAKGRRAIVRKLQGVPGLNMILVQFEGDSSSSKIKKGSISLIDRKDLHDDPFDEPVVPDDSRRRRGEDHGWQEDVKDDKSSRSSKNKKALPERNRDGREEDKFSHGNRKRRRRDEDEVHERDREQSSNKSEKRRKESKKSGRRKQGDSSSGNPSPHASWLIPNILVRIVSSKYGKNAYKEKGVVVDVTKDGEATLKMRDNRSGHQQVLHVAERHLETAIPKVGGNACILAGPHRFDKGRLLERDSKSNRGVVQLFEDMNVVTMSLDDMAEWCGPLDDDLAGDSF